MYVVKLDGMKIELFNDLNKAKLFAKRRCRQGKIKIASLSETINPVASRMHYNECFENYGAYRYNPFALAD